LLLWEAEVLAAPRSAQSGQSEYLAEPTAIALGNSTRKVRLSTPLGPVNLRWARSAEQLFGRSPERAVLDALATVSKTLKRGGFPPAISSLSETWDIVIMDENLPEGQIPTNLVNRCHPAWMVPPAKIYVVAQRISAGCSGARKLDGRNPDLELANVLIHELGHVVEYNLLKGGARPPAHDPIRAEGFATWWETYAARSSTLVSSDVLTRRYKEQAQRTFAEGQSINAAAFQFSEGEYAASSLYFHAVADARGAFGIVDLYKLLLAGTPLVPAVRQLMGWDANRLERILHDTAAKR
jgi:hypothetical protein